MYGKTDGKKNFENISNFPYPINNKTFYGSCALVASSGEKNINLSIELWKQLHKIITESDELNSFSFVNISQLTVKSSAKKEKQKKKEQDNEKEKERDAKNIEINSVIFQELEEESYCYTSDEADL
jgi:hypothetical protein